MDVAGIQLVQTTPGGVQKNCSAVVPEQQTQGLIEDSFATGERDTGSIPGKSGAWKSTVLKAAVGAAVGAGVLALSGGSVLAAIGMSAGICAGLGALKGLSHAILGNFSFNGHSGAGSALDRNPVAMSLLMGTIGAAKGAAEGLVLGGLQVSVSALSGEQWPEQPCLHWKKLGGICLRSTSIIIKGWPVKHQRESRHTHQLIAQTAHLQGKPMSGLPFFTVTGIANFSIRHSAIHNWPAIQNWQYCN